MEQFVPQSYCDVCTTVQLYCQGGTQTSDKAHWIFNMNSVPPSYIGDITASGNTHEAHWMDVYVKEEIAAGTDASTLLGMVANSTYFNAVMAAASETTASGHQGTIQLKDPTDPSLQHGVAWTMGSVIHFASQVRIAANPYSNHS